MNLNEILDAKEARWNQKLALSKEENRCVVSLTLRMPLELRLTEEAKMALSIAKEEVFSLLKNAFRFVSFKGVFSSADGPYALFTVSGEGEKIKKTLVRFEEESRFADLIDADLMTEAGDEIPRLAVGGKERKCVVCGKRDGRSCIVGRAHSREITLNAFSQILQKRMREGE